MKFALQLFSWISVVLGVLAIFGAVATVDPQAAQQSFIGGALFLIEGVLALIYVNKKEKLYGGN